jgi:predicted transcriptional regulator
MDAAALLKEARHYVGLSQRALAGKAGVPHSTVARIESGTIDPRTRTLEKLLRVCHRELDIRVVRDWGLDRTLIDSFLKLSPEDRIQSAANMSNFVEELQNAPSRRR